MTATLTIFCTLIYLTDYTYVSSSHLVSEFNLMDSLEEYIEEREMYLNQVYRYLNTIEAASKKLKDCVSVEDAMWRSWKEFLNFKRIVIDWINFLNNLHDDTNVVNSIHSSMTHDYDGKLTDWIVESNDIRLLKYVDNLINIRKTDITQNMHTKTYIKRNKNAQYLRTQLNESIINRIQNYKIILKQFINVTKYVQEEKFVYWDNYKKLCRGEKLLNNNRKNLHCSYVHNNKPYLLIGPIKREQLHVDPQIIMFHDVLLNSEIEQIQTLVAETSMYIAQNKEIEYRVAKIAWLENNLRRVNQRMELFSNLNMTASENYQVAVYGLGGHYEPHFDSDIDERHMTHRRISTIMFYMTDVDKGGATVFPKLKVAVFPKKGSALFWYNVKPNFETDVRMIHAGCPIYSGLKWVLNSWIRRDGQEFKIPCMAGHEQSFV